MSTARSFVAPPGGLRLRPPPALPERFNWLESMLFAAGPADAHRAAERYAGELLSRPVPPPRLAPTLPELVWTSPGEP